MYLMDKNGLSCNYISKEEKKLLIRLPPVVLVKVAKLPVCFIRNRYSKIVIVEIIHLQRCLELFQDFHYQHCGVFRGHFTIFYKIKRGTVICIIR